MSERDMKSWMERLSSDVEMLKRRLIRRPLGGGGGGSAPDTGWRVVSGDLINGWDGSIRIRRIGLSVYIQGNVMHGADSRYMYQLPQGFVPSGPSMYFTVLPGETWFDPTPAQVLIDYLGKVSSLIHSVDVGVTFSGSYLTDDEWPSTLPGTG